MSEDVERRPLIHTTISTYSPEVYVLTDTRSGTQWRIGRDAEGRGIWKPLETNVPEGEVKRRQSAVLREIPDRCEITNAADRTCVTFIGGPVPAPVPHSATWTKDMCCLPCRVRMAVEGGTET